MSINSITSMASQYIPKNPADNPSTVYNYQRALEAQNQKTGSSLSVQKEASAANAQLILDVFA